jgi:ubiquinone/menaquinone biosynthesis C-methylase UbiE
MTELHVGRTIDGSPWDYKAHALAASIKDRLRRNIGRSLVVGCGSGIEAATLAVELTTSVVGIDIKPQFDPRAAKFVQLQLGDATRLNFGDEQFDFVYSYHALEHIPNYRQALKEMRRVVRGGGYYCVGTPNRARLIGYLGSTEVSWRSKLKWNISDWNARLKGKFRNECGAHAGFFAEELRTELEKVFGNAEDISMAYYSKLYPQFAGMIRALEVAGVKRYVLPSVYFFGTRQDGEGVALG